MQRKASSRLIDLQDGHTTIIGLTRMGKTVAVKESVRADKVGALFFNTQYENMPNGFIRADGSSSMGKIKIAIDRGYKINFIPDLKLSKKRFQIAKIVDSLFDGKNHAMTFVVDESHLYNHKDSRESLIQVATGGLKFGIHLANISQRPAKIENTLMSQSTKFVIFQLNMEGPYLKTYHIPGEEIGLMIKTAGKYSYCEFDWSEIRGPFRV